METYNAVNSWGMQLLACGHTPTWLDTSRSSHPYDDIIIHLLYCSTM